MLACGLGKNAQRQAGPGMSMKNAQRQAGPGMSIPRDHPWVTARRGAKPILPTSVGTCALPMGN